MSHQFKPGDQALTLKAGYRFSVMINVTLDALLRQGQTCRQPDGQPWTAPHDGWVVYREGEEGCGFFKPEHLMPLRGDFTQEQQKAKEAA